MQGVAIRQAKRLGAFVIATDGNPNAICANEAHLFVHIDLKDTNGLIAFAKKTQQERGLHAVFTTATDFSHTVACIAEACKLPSHSIEATEKSTNKLLMRNHLSNAGITTIPFFSVTIHDSKKNIEKKDLEKKIKDSHLQFPAVVKPVDNMGARGCKKVNDIDTLSIAIQEALPFSKSRTVIVETFIHGKEYSIEGFIVDNQFFVTALADRHIYFPPYFIEMGHTIPAHVTKTEEKKLCDTFEKAVRSLGLTHGACKGDIFLHNGKVYIGEIAARLSGGYMSGWTVPYSSHLNVTQLALRLAFGENTEVIHELQKWQKSTQKTKVFCAERAYISIPGKVATIIGEDKVRLTPKVYEFFPRVKSQDEVVFPTNNVEKCGNILAVGKRYTSASKSAEQACQKIVLRLKPNEMSTNAFLESPLLSKKTEDNHSVSVFNFTNEQLSQFSKILKADPLVKKTIQKISRKKSKKIAYPCCISAFLTKKFDVQGRTLLKALIQIDTCESNFFSWVEKLMYTDTDVYQKVWLAFLRGGIQGALYLYDSQHT